MSLEKFKLLCWKNFTLQKRHPIAALIEIVFPILIVLVFSFARTKVNPQTHEVVEYKSFFPSSYKDCRTSSYEPFVKLGVSPESNQKLVELVNSTVVRNSKFQLVTFGNASDLENFVTRENFTIGIEFSDKYAVS